MIVTVGRQPAARSPTWAQPLRRGFTLMELVVSMAIATVLMGGIASAIVVAGHALPNRESTYKDVLLSSDAVELIAAELFCAVTFPEHTATSMKFTVSDRDNDASPETIRYAWSGSAGDPLTRQYNGGAVVNVVDAVQDFFLEYTHSSGPLSGLPRVLLMVANDAALTAQESARRQTIESWGFTVQPLSSSASAAALATAVQTADVVYAPIDTPAGLAPLLVDLEIGVVLEERNLIEDVGLARTTNWLWSATLNITDNTHEITRTLATGSLAILTSADYLIFLHQDPAPGGQSLASITGSDLLFAVEVGGLLYGGGTATGRRVAMPWGDRTFDFNRVNANGETIMQRAIRWAAAPVGVSQVNIALQKGSDPDGRVETKIQTLNLPN